jgi:hypothetical protein
VIVLLAEFAGVAAENPQREDFTYPLATIRKGVPLGLANGLWYHDQYRDLKPLLGHTEVTVADIEGPGVITLMHITRALDEDRAKFARGIVLQVFYDNETSPAIQAPLADFFGDGCNGKSTYFSSNLIELVPEAYNSYIPMPFRKRAKIVLRNDTDDYYFGAYTAIEWQKLPVWNPSLGYLHATYTRKVFRLVPETKVTFFQVEGSGHLIGRQLSLVTSEPAYLQELRWVVEGNNELEIDGQKKQINYLGSEDSFTFSYGFRRLFTGQHVGVTFRDFGSTLSQLSVFRFHDHMPIRFDKSLAWTIDWQYESTFVNPPAWRERVGPNGGWVDYAFVFYWYMDTPAGYEHEPLAPLQERILPMLPPPEHPLVFSFPKPNTEAEIENAFRKIPVDPQLVNRFSTPDDMARVFIVGAYPKTHPFFIDKPEPISGRRMAGIPGNPNPGRTGIVAVHPKDLETPCLLIRKLQIPSRDKPVLRIVVSGDPYKFEPDNVGQSGFGMRVGVFDGQKTEWLDKQFVTPGDQPSPANWRTFSYDLGGFSGEVVAVVIEVTAEGANQWFNKEGFFDEFSVTTE